ncbi:hypothetical protein GCM10028806_34620 [Spirosoma terrae]|uniref:Uncharacterized protein n=1 Tax=Spirosoma terrae TaxID=1968276 RepID=A0A6L9L5E4_9BACT|nr:hypothetical protein [Spirosoma terrae]NDU95776.1 hypothetical protein [Spirosoma terrae]
MFLPLKGDLKTFSCWAVLFYGPAGNEIILLRDKPDTSNNMFFFVQENNCLGRLSIRGFNALFKANLPTAPELVKDSTWKIDILFGRNRSTLTQPVQIELEWFFDEDGNLVNFLPDIG